jgi:hypothetical protein
VVVNKDVEQLKKRTKGIKWWQEGRLPKVISGSETGKAQKAVPGVVGFEQISVEPIQKYTQFKKFESDEFTLANETVFSTSDGVFVVHSLLVSAAEDVIEAEGIVHIIGRNLEKDKHCVQPSWEAKVKNTFKVFQLCDVQNTLISRTEMLATGTTRLFVDDFVEWVAK